MRQCLQYKECLEELVKKRRDEGLELLFDEMFQGRMAQQELLGKDVPEENSMLPTVSRVVLLMAMAEDLGIPYLWDYETLVMLQFYESSVEPLIHGEGAHEKYQDFAETGQKEFLETYDASYCNDRSLLGLISKEQTDRLGELMVRIFDLYQISSRKLSQLLAKKRGLGGWQGK